MLRVGYNRALDGVRAVAVLAVLACHADLLLAAGFLGVDAFFVLSGFLITLLLLHEWRRTGTIHLRHFYIRRGLRLGPAMLMVVAAVAIYSLAFAPEVAVAENHREANLRGVLATLLYAANRIRAFWPSPNDLLGILGHTWSLAIEEQFYLLWPGMLLLAVTRGFSSKVVGVATVALIALSALLRGSESLAGPHGGACTTGWIHAPTSCSLARSWLNWRSLDDCRVHSYSST